MINLHTALSMFRSPPSVACVGTRAFFTRSRRSGFTLIELMVVIAIASILAMLAIPSFIDMIQRNRVSGEVNSFVGDLQYARSEAIQHGQSVTLCPSSDGLNCLGANQWNLGWIVFSDINGTGVPAAGTVTRVRAAWSGSDTFVATPAKTAITYGRNGFATNIGAAPVSVRAVTTPANTSATRCVVVNIVGRQQVQSLGGAQCP
jgi:type IV fimbrial biogenesis protein FimT